MTAALDTPFRLPCGAVLKNRIGKAPMTEGLADPMNRATDRHVRLYRRWAEGGAGLLVTGNVQVDRRYLERPGNVVIDGNGGERELEAYARAGTAGGTHLWMQIGHAGRQTPKHVNPVPVAPSAIRGNLSESQHGMPRALSSDEVWDVVRRFAHVANVAKQTGFTGVQIHGAHGYLISEFLSPLANQRTDQWGGSPENRARLLLETAKAVRTAVGPDFPVSIKLNSADFQQGGFSNDDCLDVLRWLAPIGIDLIEVSGGNYESPRMMGFGREPTAARASTLAREAYFLDYATRIRQATRIPIMLSGGFRSRAAMDEALVADVCDVIGIGRPLCVDTDLPRRLIDRSVDAATSYESTIKPERGGLAWFCLQLIRLGDGEEPDRALTGDQAIPRYVANERATAAGLIGRRLEPEAAPA